MVLSILTAAISPGIALLSYFYLKDRYESEPIGLVIRVFLFGGLLVFPIMMLQRTLAVGFGDNPFVFSFLLSSGIEEFFKWFVIYYVIYKHVEFDEPYDGIVYAVAVSLGFATVENVLYSLLNFSTFGNLIMRALLPVSGHALFGVMMGYHLGRAKFHPSNEKKHLLFSLSLPILYHGLFDYILLNAKSNWLWLMFPLMLFLWIRGLWKVRHANARSPFRAVRREDEIKI